MERFWSKVDKAGPGDCWEWQGFRHRQGYGRIWLDGRRQLAHRVALALSQGVDIPGPEVKCLHSCDNPPCVNPAHLRWGSDADNVRDRDARGRRDAPKGEANGRAIIPDDEALALVLRVLDGETCVDVARGVGMSERTLQDWARGKFRPYLLEKALFLKKIGQGT